MIYQFTVDRIERGETGEKIPWNGNDNGTGAECRKRGLYGHSFLVRTYFLQRHLRRVCLQLRTRRDAGMKLSIQTFVSHGH